MRHIMINMTENVNEDELDEILINADTDGDGFIKYEEFIRMLLTKDNY